MNCQDLALVLDEGDIDHLTDVQRREAEAHLATCSVCSMERQIQHRLASVAAPPLPPGLIARCLKLVAAAPVRADSRRASRRIVAGVALAIAAAAAVFVVQVASPPSVPGTSTAAVDEPAKPAAVAEQTAPAASNDAAAESSESSALSERPENKPAVAATAVLVQLMPLDTKGLDATSVLMLDQFHVTFARGLAVTPGVTMLSADAPAPAGRFYQIRLKLAGVRADGARAITVATMMVRDGKLDTALGTNIMLDPGADVGPPVARVLDSLRAMIFPGDPSLRNELNAKLRDPAADRAAKQAAMTALLAPSMAPAPAERIALYGTALDMVIAEADPAARDAIWNQLENRISPEFMDVVNAALTRLQDPDLRRKLISYLVNRVHNLDDPGMRASMKANSPEVLVAMDAIAPAVRARLESIADSDPSRLNRMVATRAFAGEDKWNEYVVASLKDTILADGERLGAFAYLGGGMQLNVSVNNPLLDEAAIRSAGELIARVGRDPDQEQQAIKAVKVLASVRGDAARDAALKILRTGSGLGASSPVRAAMLVPLVMSKGADPAVREAVEELASRDPNPLMRRRATEVLQVADQLTKDKMPLQMLQSSPLIENATPAR